jgi:foldase protein PrsA
MLLNRRLHKWMFAMMALLLVVSVLSACGKKKDTGAAAATGKPTDVIATYKDNGKVTRAEFDSFVNVNKLFNSQLAMYITDPAFQQDFLKQLITFRILSARADDKVKADADKQVATQMTQVQDYLSKLEGGMDKALKDNNITLKDIESLMKISFYSMMSLEAKVTDQQIQAAYDAKVAAHQFDIATVSHILIATKDAATQKDIRTIDEALTKANEVLDKLKKGGDFAALAKEYSDDPGSKDAGGTYKDADITQWVPEFGQAAGNLPLNTISDPPVKTSYGYHIMKVESRSVKKDLLKSELAQKSLGDFADKELPGLITSNKLPMPSAVPAASAPAASPSSSPAAK